MLSPFRVFFASVHFNCSTTASRISRRNAKSQLDSGWAENAYSERLQFHLRLWNIEASCCSRKLTSRGFSSLTKISWKCFLSCFYVFYFLYSTWSTPLCWKSFFSVRICFMQTTSSRITRKTLSFLPIYQRDSWVHLWKIIKCISVISAFGKFRLWKMY